MKPTNFSIDHSVAVYVLIAMIVVGGLITYIALPREAAPDITIPVVIVTTPYYGVAPADIETLVTQPMEKELQELKDVDDLTSTSAEGASIITVKFAPNVDIDDAVQKMREKVDKAKPKLPDDAEDPILTEINFSEFPIMIVNISGPVDQLQLKRVGEDLQDRIEKVPGVLDVKLAGGLEREIQVNVDPARLQRYQLSLSEVIGTLQRENVNLPGGSVDVGRMSYLVRVDGEFKDAAPIANLVIKEKDGQPIYLGDVAEVSDTYKKQDTYSRFQNSTNVSLSVQKRAGENLIRISDDVKEILADYKSAEQPEGVSVEITADVSRIIRDQVNDLENNILTGLILVVGILFFFMGGVRNSLFVASAIPLSMLISFIVLSIMDITLNMVVLFALVLALGMLVDNAIVIVENIYRHGMMGKSRIQASKDAVAEVGWPVISSTVTTVVAFAPMLFWPGVTGEFMGFLPMTVIIVLTSSLFVALVINPVFCATLMKVTDRGPTDELEAIPKNFVYSAYRRTLEFALSYRWIVVVLSILSLFGTFAAYGALGHGVEFFPETTPERLFMNIREPDGTAVETTNAVTGRIEQHISTLDNVQTQVSTVGVASGAFATFGTASNQARINIDLLPAGEQVENPKLTIQAMRDFTDAIAGAEFEVDKEKMGPPAGKPINIEITGKDYHKLGALAQQVRATIRDTEGLQDLKDDYVSGRPEVRVHVDRRQAGISNINTFQIADTVRAAINGVTATKIRDGEDEYDVVVRLQRDERDSIEDIEGLTVVGKEGAQIPLREVAHIEEGGGTGSIRHHDLERVVTVQANVTEGHLPNDVLAAVQKRLENQKMPEGYAIKFTGENEEQQKAADFLGKALLAALFLITLVLVTQFNSVLQPMVIVASVLLSLIGVLWGLIITQTPFGIIMVGIGVISLAGVVVNNAIVLIDYANQLKERGFPQRIAIIQAGMVRFRPVMLTAVTTILGLVPMVVGVSFDFFQLEFVFGGRSVEMWGPMARSVAAGLLVATLLTLVVVPVLYSLAEDLGAFLTRIFGLGESTPAAIESAPGPELSPAASELQSTDLPNS